MIRSWEVAGTREIPEWEREALERLGPHLQTRCNCDGDWWGGDHVTTCPVRKAERWPSQS